MYLYELQKIEPNLKDEIETLWTELRSKPEFQNESTVEQGEQWGIYAIEKKYLSQVLFHIVGGNENINDTFVLWIILMNRFFSSLSFKSKESRYILIRSFHFVDKERLIKYTLHFFATAIVDSYMRLHPHVVTKKYSLKTHCECIVKLRDSLYKLISKPNFETKTEKERIDRISSCLNQEMTFLFPGFDRSGL